MTNKVTNDAITSGLEQMNAVLQAWKTLPNAMTPSIGGAPLQQFTDFASDLRDIYAETFNRYRDLLVQETTELSGWTPAPMQVGQPQGAMEASLKMMTSMLEASSQRAKIWTDMSKQLGTRYAALAHQLADNIDQTTGALTDETPKTTSASKSK